MASKITLKRLTDLFAKSSIDIEQAGSFLEYHTAGVAAEIVRKFTTGKDTDAN